MELQIHREILGDDFTLGTLSINNEFFGYTCEDKDRKLESGGEKVYGKTAIPRGRYKVELTYSPHFSRVTPELVDVPYFSNIRIHGGNTSEDTLGCPLLGATRTKTGVSNCAERNTTLIAMMERAEDFGEEVWIEVA